ncbi:MAG: hypothetical protein NVV60_02600 [Luteimonas sp.]|nr:hypothetical protein [Luteimonas sp.]
MELDELKQAWQSLGHKLERSEAIQWQLLRDSKLDKVRRSLRPLYWGQAMQILLGIGLVVLGIACWSRNVDATVLFATGISVHVFGVVNIIMAGITMGLIAGIDYSAPVVAIQRQNARLLRTYLLNGNVCGLSWWIMWLPVTMAFAGLGRVDLSQQAPTYIWSGIAVSALGLAGTWLYYRRLESRAAAGAQSHTTALRKVGDGADGIRRGQRLLDEIASFERE